MHGSNAWMTLFLCSRTDAVGEEGQYFQGDIRLLPADDPYDLYQTVFKRMAFDRPGSGDMELDSNNLTARLWPNARVPYRFDTGLSKLQCNPSRYYY